jgi:hypothetical protein
MNMVQQTNNFLGVLRGHDLIDARERIDAADNEEREKNHAASIEAMPTLLVPRELSPWQRRLVALGSIAATMLITYVALKPETTLFVNEKIHEAGQMFGGEHTPAHQDATKITVGDVIRYKTKDGKIKERRIRFLSDITVAAREVDPSIDYNDFDDMLARQNGNSNIVHTAQTSVDINKNLGITDIGASGS